MIGPQVPYGPHLRGTYSNVGSNATWGFLHQNVPGMARYGGAIRSYMGSQVHQAGMEWTKQLWGIGQKGGFARWGGRAFLGFAAFSGYQEARAQGKSGAWGATKGIASTTASNYVIGAGMRALGLSSTAGTIAGGVAIGAALQVGALTHMAQVSQGGGLGHLLARPAVYQHMRQHAMLEMGRPAIDMYGTAATMRQRSLAAIQDSKLNGRVAIGNEATLQYRSYFR